MRLLLTTLLVLLPGLADAQRQRPRPPAPEPPAATLPPIGLPLPEIGLRLAPLGLAPPVTSTTSEPAAPSRRHHPRPPSGKGRTGPGVVYVMPAYPWDWYGAAVPGTTAPAASAAEPAVTPAAAARLRLEVEPRGVAEIYVDGYFVGTADDRRDEVALEPGSHRVDIRAPGYESERVDVRLEAGDSATLRRSLQREGGAPPLPWPAQPAPAPIARKPFYFIPGCYLGDVPPKDAGLPASCDQSKTVVVKP